MFEGRDSCSISVHQHYQMDHHNFFAAVEPIFWKYNGRPHWGKLHSLNAKNLQPLYPRWRDFLALRQQPILHAQHFRLRGFIRQVLHHLAHISLPQPVFIAGQLVAQHQLRPLAEPVEQQLQGHRIPAFRQLAGGDLLLEQLLHPFHRLRALFAHALPLQTQRRHRRTGPGLPVGDLHRRRRQLYRDHRRHRLCLGHCHRACGFRGGV